MTTHPRRRVFQEVRADLEQLISQPQVSRSCSEQPETANKLGLMVSQLQLLLGESVNPTPFPSSAQRLRGPAEHTQRLRDSVHSRCRLLETPETRMRDASLFSRQDTPSQTLEGRGQPQYTAIHTPPPQLPETPSSELSAPWDHSGSEASPSPSHSLDLSELSVSASPWSVSRAPQTSPQRRPPFHSPYIQHHVAAEPPPPPLEAAPWSVYRAPSPSALVARSRASPSSASIDVDLQKLRMRVELLQVNSLKLKDSRTSK